MCHCESAAFSGSQHLRLMVHRALYQNCQRGFCSKKHVCLRCFCSKRMWAESAFCQTQHCIVVLNCCKCFEVYAHAASLSAWHCSSRLCSFCALEARRMLVPVISVAIRMCIAARACAFADSPNHREDPAAALERHTQPRIIQRVPLNLFAAFLQIYLFNHSQTLRSLSVCSKP